MLGKRRKLGRGLDEISVGEKLTLTEKIEDKDLLLYLGLTDDANPIYIQHDYASQTPYKKPIVPAVMLVGIISSAVSKFLPGPGSVMLRQQLDFPSPAYHYSTIEFEFFVLEVDKHQHFIRLSISGVDEEGNHVVDGELHVAPPFPPEPLTGKIMENF